MVVLFMRIAEDFVVSITSSTEAKKSYSWSNSYLYLNRKVPIKIFTTVMHTPVTQGSDSTVYIFSTYYRFK